MSLAKQRCFFLANLCCAYPSAFQIWYYMHSNQVLVIILWMQWRLQSKPSSSHLYEGWAVNDSLSEPDSMGCIKVTVGSTGHTLVFYCIALHRIVQFLGKYCVGMNKVASLGAQHQKPFQLTCTIW